MPREELLVFPGPITPLRMACIVLCFTLPFPAFSRPKTDVLVMTNGDRFTCEVKRLENGILQVDLDYVDGTISVDWRKVAQLESNLLFLVEMQDGTRYSGKLITPEALPGVPVKIEIQPEATAPLVVDRSSVVRMTQYSESFLKRFAGNITAGAVYSKGNNATQYNLGSSLTYPQTRWGASLDYNSNLSSNSGAPTSTRNQLDFRAYRMFPWKNYFYVGSAGFLQSSVQQIQRQTILGIGVGRYLKNSNRVRFSIQGGLGWQQTNYVPSFAEQRFQNIAVAMVGPSLEIFSFKKTRLNFNAYVLPALNQGGRTFSRVNTSYYIKLFGKIDWNLSFYGNWDTAPPAHLPSSDYGTSAGLSWSFGNN
jgi:hypothetical protein